MRGWLAGLGASTAFVALSVVLLLALGAGLAPHTLFGGHATADDPGQGIEIIGGAPSRALTGAPADEPSWIDRAVPRVVRPARRAGQRAAGRSGVRRGGTRAPLSRRHGSALAPRPSTGAVGGSPAGGSSPSSQTAAARGGSTAGSGSPLPAPPVPAPAPPSSAGQVVDGAAQTAGSTVQSTTQAAGDVLQPVSPSAAGAVQQTGQAADQTVTQTGQAVGSLLGG